MQVVIISNQIIVIVITQAEEKDLCQDFNVFKNSILFNKQTFTFSLFFLELFSEPKERKNKRKLCWKKEGATWIIHSNSVMWMPIEEKYSAFNKFLKTSMYIHYIQCIVIQLSQEPYSIVILLCLHENRLLFSFSFEIYLNIIHLLHNRLHNNMQITFHLQTITLQI